MPTVYPVKPVFALIRRTPHGEADDSFTILGIYTDERQVHAIAQELSGTRSGPDDPFFYYVAADLIDPRQG